MCFVTYESESLEALGGVDDLEAISDALVHLRVSLKSELDPIEVSVTYLRHLTISSGQMAAWVRPHAKIPPTIHLA